MSKYFTLPELLRSDTALRKKIENLPSFEVIFNLNRLANFLDELREAWGGPIRINSGFRSAQLNAAVGGVQGSAHLYGNAVDMVPANGRMAEFEQFLRKWLAGRKWDQCIYESSRTGGRWIHFALYSNKGEQRCKLFSMAV